MEYFVAVVIVAFKENCGFPFSLSLAKQYLY